MFQIHRILRILSCGWCSCKVRPVWKTKTWKAQVPQNRIPRTDTVLLSCGGRVDRWLYISRILSVFIQSVGDGSHEREIINIGKHRSISVFNRYLIHYLDTKFEVESFDLKLYRHEEIRKKTSRKLFYIGVVAYLWRLKLVSKCVSETMKLTFFFLEIVQINFQHFS